MTADEEDRQPVSSEPIQDLDDANVGTDAADSVKGGFNPQPEPPGKIRGLDPQPDPPVYRNPIQGY